MSDKLEILRAEHSGFCFGVKQAIDKAINVAENKGENEKIFSFGPLIHNKIVTNQLEEKGVFIIDSLDDILEESTVIIRSHGIGEWFYNEAEKKNLTVIDGTCPYVKKIHSLVNKACDDGKQIIIVGDKKHPEVEGISGWCKGAIAINKSEDAEKYDKPVFVVAQTTIRKSLFDEVLEQIKKLNDDVEYQNTICNATVMRQAGCRDLSSEVDVMVVVGDNNSSNSKKLYEIAKKYCEKAYFIENADNLPLQDLQQYNRIGVAAGASTPESAIKEVIIRMSENITREESMLDYMEEIEKSLRLPRNGELVQGKVHHVTDDEVIVNIGCKKDGVIPKSEVVFENPEQTLTDLFNVGDEISAKVLKSDDGEGTILLSRKRLEVGKHWEEINKAFEEKELLDVEVIRQTNGGVIASYKEVNGFIPLSQLSDRFVEDSSEFVGQTLSVKVSRVDARKNKVVFSRKAKLLEDRQQLLEQIWSSINIGDIVEGKVMRFTDYGAFVDIGGIDGLLHISEISWGKLKHPKEVLEIGQTVNVKILSMNTEKGKVSLGLKQTTQEPWTVIDEHYQVGQVVSGKIVQIKEYGCFVELEPGLDGLVHISEVSHKRIANIADEVSIGQEVGTKILEIDKDRKRISLSIKETLEPSTEEELAEAAAVAEETPVVEGVTEEVAE
ncbi:MAG: bifunctional 4-hydroxy-3-methylbut-2-enyl diphosphate reductase/30S ribosomal protein S1 [Eubacteriales bacterium]|nr:bifunctional 4-hydroxy-3-methylbut-2-enyl diphosphate reductase/30S ribosomal protein S1 [Eubacteriales bacterium]MDY3332609.1 bifunctional 4-hydroxy-3-methylbut-2-enyl diphosphate reductase/30S ribosomal protein S1 [Gallibacter sp.]